MYLHYHALLRKCGEELLVIYSKFYFQHKILTQLNHKP